MKPDIALISYLKEKLNLPILDETEQMNRLLLSCRPKSLEA